MDQKIKDYLKSKYFTEPDEFDSEEQFFNSEINSIKNDMKAEQKFDDSESQAVMEDDLRSLQRDSQDVIRQNNIMKGISTIGGAIAGVKPNHEFYDDLNKQQSNRVQDWKLRNEEEISSQKRVKDKEKLDPNSSVSKNVRDAYKKVAPNIVAQISDFDQLSASDIEDNLARPLELHLKLEDRKLARQEAGLRRQELLDARNFKLDEQREEKNTPFGMARTKDDAKQLKEASESKANFDRKITELISLREKFGGEMFNREAVARGKQLSKDLLLEYKNMAKLGVLSKADEDIINAIIPDDPLGFSASTLVGQDPILHKLKKFKGDVQKDFESRLANRLDPRFNKMDQAESEEVVNVLSPDGKVRKVPKALAEQALSAGGVLVDHTNTVQKNKNPKNGI